MEKVRNIFAIDIGRYSNNTRNQKDNFLYAKSIWSDVIQIISSA